MGFGIELSGGLVGVDGGNAALGVMAGGHGKKA